MREFLVGNPDHVLGGCSKPEHKMVRIGGV